MDILMWEEKYSILQKCKEKGKRGRKSMFMHRERCLRVWLDLMAPKNSQLEMGLEWWALVKIFEWPIMCLGFNQEQWESFWGFKQGHIVIILIGRQINLKNGSE